MNFHIPAVRLPLLLAATLLVGCAGLTTPLPHIVQPPRFEPASQPPEIRMLAPGPTRPSGGAAIRIWTKVTNPNAFAFTLTGLETTLLIEEERAATADFPLGLAVAARRESDVPLDLMVSLSDLPHLRGAVRRAANGLAVAYRLDGTIDVDAGRLGQRTFGPMTLMSGDLLTR